MIIERVIKKAEKIGNSAPKSGFTFARPSFATGLARLFDFGGTLNNYYYVRYEDPQESDARALASDWEAVGKDIADAIEQYGVSIKYENYRQP